MLSAYRDTVGKLTIARGFNLDAPGASDILTQLSIDYQGVRNGQSITVTQADALFAYSYGSVVRDLHSIFPSLNSYPDNVGAVLSDMRYELGASGFRQFKMFIAAILREDWPGAIAQMKHSLWQSQVPGRVANDVALMEAA